MLVKFIPPQIVQWLVELIWAMERPVKTSLVEELAVIAPSARLRLNFGVKIIFSVIGLVMVIYATQILVQIQGLIVTALQVILRLIFAATLLQGVVELRKVATFSWV